MPLHVNTAGAATGADGRGVKVYHITGGKSLPDWVAAQRKRSLRLDPEWRDRIELIQDFDFPEAALRIKQTRDGTHILATGVYKPQLRCYDVKQLSMRFDRHMDAETVQFQTLGDDWSKLVFLQADRHVEFHAQGGTYYRTRVPKFGRDMSYNNQNCDLVVVGASSEAWRLNLDQGRFLNSFQTSCASLNICKVHPQHQLTALGSEDGQVEFWDPRVRRCIGTANVGAEVVRRYNEVASLPEITALRYHGDGLRWCVGTSSGHALLYDLRASTPMLVKDHQYGQPIKDIKFHPTSGHVFTADTKILKIWNENNGELYTSIEPSTDINDVCVVGGSGLVLMANEEPRMHAHYIPSIGPAPYWCSFLDNLTEELEETQHSAVYDDYKFVTRKELETLGLDHLVGTPMLRAYMHGFFLNQKLYQKAQAIANPFQYDEYRKRVVQEKLSKENASRISLQRRLPKVNRELAQRLLQQAEVKQGKGKAPAANEELAKIAGNPLGDDRFKAMFSNPEYSIDRDSAEYKTLHPSLRDRFQKVADASDDDDDDDNDGAKAGEDEVEGRESDASSEDSDDDLAAQVQRKQQPAPRRKKASAPAFYELQDGVTPRAVLGAANGTAAAAATAKAAGGPRGLSFGQRLQGRGDDTAGPAAARLPTSGPMEYRFLLPSKGGRGRGRGGGRGGRGGRGDSSDSSDSASAWKRRAPPGASRGRGGGGRGRR